MTFELIHTQAIERLDNIFNSLEKYIERSYDLASHGCPPDYYAVFDGIRKIRYYLEAYDLILSADELSDYSVKCDEFNNTHLKNLEELANSIRKRS